MLLPVKKSLIYGLVVDFLCNLSQTQLGQAGCRRTYGGEVHTRKDPLDGRFRRGR